MAAVSLPSPQTEIGFIAHLLINEAPFPGERAYVSEADTMQTMDSILNVLVARLAYVPVPYRQTRCRGGHHRQYSRHHHRGRGPRTGRRILPRLQWTPDGGQPCDRAHRQPHEIANTGQPGRFARLLDHAVSVSSDYARRSTIPYDPYARLTVVDGIPVTGRAFSWMTDQSFYHPGRQFCPYSRRQSGRSRRQSLLFPSFESKMKAFIRTSIFALVHLGNRGHTPRRGHASKRVDPYSQVNREYAYELLRYLYRWYLDDDLFIHNPEVTEATEVEFWVRPITPEADEERQKSLRRSAPANHRDESWF